jgi:hypothetical protein
MPLDRQLGSRTQVTTVSYATLTERSPKFAWTGIMVRSCGGQKGTHTVPPLWVDAHSMLIEIFPGQNWAFCVRSSR